MTLNKDTASLLRNDPSAIYINLSSDPSIKSLLPTIKSSSKLKVLGEGDDYIIVTKVSPTTQVARKPCSTTMHLSKPIFVQRKRYHRFKKKNTCFTHFLNSIGIQAKSIKQTNESTDGLHIVNASGIIF